MLENINLSYMTYMTIETSKYKITTSNHDPELRHRVLYYEH